jgi:hypothetical protein
MSEFEEVMKDFKAFITKKTPEEREIILESLENWTGELILMGVGKNENNKKNNT